jgi:hypothetical protein
LKLQTDCVSPKAAEPPKNGTNAPSKATKMGGLMLYFRCLGQITHLSEAYNPMGARTNQHGFDITAGSACPAISIEQKKRLPTAGVSTDHQT